MLETLKKKKLFLRFFWEGKGVGGCCRDLWHIKKEGNVQNEKVLQIAFADYLFVSINVYLFSIIHKMILWKIIHQDRLDFIMNKYFSSFISNIINSTYFISSVHCSTDKVDLIHQQKSLLRVCKKKNIYHDIKCS